MLTEFINVLNTYIGDGLYFAFYIVAIFILCRNEYKKGISIFSLATILVTIGLCNPVSIKVMGHFLDVDRLSKLYYAIPILVIIALAIANYFSERWHIVVLVIILLIAGSATINRNDFSKASNPYKVDDSVIDVAEYILEDSDEKNPKVAAQEGTATQLRQYAPQIKLEVGRKLAPAQGSFNRQQIMDIMYGNPINISALEDLAIADGCTYIIIESNWGMSGSFDYYDKIYTNGILDVYKYNLDRAKANWIMKRIPSVSDSQGMSYTFKNAKTGSYVVIDGGWPEDAAVLRQEIADNGGVVDAWFLSHYHSDHISAFNEIYANPGDIQIKEIYVSPFNYDYFMSVAEEWDNVDTYQRFLDLTKGDDRIKPVYRNDEIEIDGLKFHILNSWDDSIATIGDVGNNGGMMIKISGQEDNILMCMDCHTDALADEMIRMYGDEMKAEYVQCGHHGNNSFSTYVYDYIDPKVAFFDLPEHIMNSDGYTAKALNEYFELKGVKTFDFTDGVTAIGFN